MNRLSSSENLNRFSSKRLSCRVASRNVPRNSSNQVGVVEAILSGSTDALARALKSGADSNETDKDGLPAIFLTLEKSGRPDMLRLLLEHRAEPDARQAIVKRTCLHAAAKLGYQLCVASLLNYGADASLVDFKGNTALMHAARNGHSPIVRLLAKHEADHGKGKNSIADIANLRGETVLHAAVESADLETVRLLTRGAVDTNRPDHTGKTPFLLACRLNNLAVAEILCEESYKEIDINAREPDNGRTGLFWAVLHANVKLVQLLLDRGAEVDVPDKEWQTPFLLAVKRGGDELIMKLLLDAGCNAAVTDRSFNTALHYAASEGIAECLPLLVRAGLDPNIKGACGLTALMLASYRGHVDVVKLLLAFGSNPDLQDRLHCSATAYALVGENKKQPSYASPKLRSGNDPVLQCVKALIRSNCNLNTGNGFKRLCTCYSIDLVNRNVEDLEDEKMYTPLEIAFLRNNVDAFKILIQAGCDLHSFTLSAKYISKCKDKSASSSMISFLNSKRKAIPPLKMLCRKPSLTNFQLQGIPINEIADFDLSDDILDLLNFKDLDLRIDEETACSYMDKINCFNSIINLQNKTHAPTISPIYPSKDIKVRSSQSIGSTVSPNYNAKSAKLSAQDNCHASQMCDETNVSSFNRSFSMRPTKLPVIRNVSNSSYVQPLHHGTKANLSRSNSFKTLKQSSTPNSSAQPVWGSDKRKAIRTRTTSFSEDNNPPPSCLSKNKFSNLNEYSTQTKSPAITSRSISSTNVNRQQRHSLMLENDYTNYKKNDHINSTSVLNTSYAKPSNYTQAVQQKDISGNKPYNSNPKDNEKCQNPKSNRETDGTDIDELINRYKNRYKSEDTSSFYEHDVDNKLIETPLKTGQMINSKVNTKYIDEYSLNDCRNESYSLTEDVFDELEKRANTWTKVDTKNDQPKRQNIKTQLDVEKSTFTKHNQNFNNSNQISNYSHSREPTNQLPAVQLQETQRFPSDDSNPQLDNYISNLYDRYLIIKKSNMSEKNNNNNKDIFDAKINEDINKCAQRISQSTSSSTDFNESKLKDNLNSCQSNTLGIAENNLQFKQYSPSIRSLRKSTVVISSVVPPAPKVDDLSRNKDDLSQMLLNVDEKGISFNEYRTNDIHQKYSDNRINGDNSQELAFARTPITKQTEQKSSNAVHNFSVSESASGTIKSNFVRSASTPENRRYASLRAPKTKTDLSATEAEQDFVREKKSSFKSRLKAIKESVHTSKPKTKQPIMQNFLLR